MASGPSGTGGWADLVALLNVQFEDANRGNFARKFKEKHGADGEGKDTGTTRYKFGQFVDRHGGFLSGAALGQFLIDSGQRHWQDASLGLMEHTIKHSLTQANPKKIVFTVLPDTTGSPTARAEVRDQNGNELKTPAQVDAQASYKITVFCPPNNPRPKP